MVAEAEDGIRDIGVTGVQTCALPISGCRLGTVRQGFTPPARSEIGRACFISTSQDRRKILMASAGTTPSFLSSKTQSGSQSAINRTLRSEERRVGKECRS